jgi:hypothetical protein
MKSNFNGQTQINFTRHSSLDSGWYSAAGSYRKGSERIPKSAWVFVAVFASIGFLALKVASVVGF